VYSGEPFRDPLEDLSSEHGWEAQRQARNSLSTPIVSAYLLSNGFRERVSICGEGRVILVDRKVVWIGGLDAII
jgi:hypothetical protein